ncbi:IclR family transcriptional regulator [Acidihalobacter ferrooxydans]|uniref:IclR family transcriptional regulator n=1 Tax=Acidihalobacter ferrooxydans TaxID=1765967 RepID=A0A1P8UGD5_9GAMM|nr:IclR family transcriptional regulator [Acidihalobacter ferrooxydans]APZ42907.1 IclR family transcriptional regulator [Acidihalobacter ferrooxydans]
MSATERQSPSGIQVIDRMSQLLDAIARYTGPVSLKVLAAETGLHSSTVFRILGALASHGFVERDEGGGGGYRLGRRLLQLGARVRSGVDIRQAALPAMAWLRDEVGESVNLTIREGDEVIYVERAVPNRMMRVEQIIGSRAPLHVTAVGKMMLGFEGAEAIHEYARRTGLRAFTANTLVDAQRLIEVSAAALAQGYAYDDEEAEQGVGCIGTLVRDATGAVVAGLSISAPIERRRDAWAALLLEASARISAHLGYRS